MKRILPLFLLPFLTITLLACGSGTDNPDSTSGNNSDTTSLQPTDDSAVIIDATAPNASAAAKKVVSCRMVLRTVGAEAQTGVPVGATQGSMTALGYTQSWTISGGGSSGELYLSKADRRILGCGNAIGSYSPVQELVPPPPAEVVL